MSDISVVMLGTGSPRPNLNRSQPAQALVVGDQTILIDCGEGTTAQLMKAGIKPESIKYLIFTHLHSDHTMGYAQFLLGGWGQGRSELTIIGPRGTKDFHESILNMYSYDIDYRCSLGRSGAGIRDVEVIEFEEPGELIENPLPYKITTARMIHNVPTFAFRFDIDGKAIVISSDTSPNEAIVHLAEGADILVQNAGLTTGKKSEALEKIWEQLQKEHCSPTQAGVIAKKANVKKVVLTHFLPEADGRIALQEASAEFTGEVIVPEDLQVINVG
ncbi:MBL fold metallo-hydrolase [Halalkalibacter alkaliphilus]|uniref:MBL fold metallo-hydrolase n=1 Tax=Halalkalibacter alkaliphilus TaxID=2917993 RepID=A0A9X2CUM1_9BACI|nr:MBL fold metallo-hydrolase [Halalkalibacter alkaliphilus]MCL7748542.1 MBL fold metallo-hydrolase [Halalkalibacter alkaliphilus]